MDNTLGTLPSIPLVILVCLKYFIIFIRNEAVLPFYSKDESEI